MDIYRRGKNISNRLCRLINKKAAEEIKRMIETNRTELDHVPLEVLENKVNKKEKKIKVKEVIRSI